VSNLTGVSSRAMLEALVAGERDPEVLAQYAQKRMRSKIPELVEALTGRFGDTTSAHLASRPASVRA
jgi:transposase